jgi:hypothetical protein
MDPRGQSSKKKFNFIECSYVKNQSLFETVVFKGTISRYLDGLEVVQLDRAKPEEKILMVT